MQAIKVKYNGDWKPLPDEKRMKLAYEEYKAKFPEADVELEDFRYVGGKASAFSRRF